MYLMHHGIKGMRWGIRRYQNPDGTLTPEGKRRYRDVLRRESGIVDVGDIDSETRLADQYNKSGIIPKGTKAYRVAGPEDILDDKRKYVSLTTEGRDSYQEQYVEGMLGNGADRSYDITNIEYEAIKDLKLASSKQVDDFIASTRPDKTKYTTILKDLEDLEKVGQTNYYTTTNPSKLVKEVRQYMEDGRHYLYKARKEALFSTKYDENNPVFKHFMDLGYDAISDVEDGGLGNGNYLAPVIILNPSNSLKETVRYKE